MAAPSLRAFVQGTPTTASSAVMTKPTGTAENDILIADLYVETDGAITLPSGWAQLDMAECNTSGSAFRHYMFWKRAGASEGSSYTFSWTGGVWRDWAIRSYQGALTTGNPFSFSANTEKDNMTGSAYPDISGTTTDADEMLVWGGGNYQVPSAHTPPTGFTEINDSSGADVYICEKVQASAGATGNVTGASYSGPASTTTSILAGLRPVAAPSAVTPERYAAFYPNRTREPLISIPI